MSDTERRFDQNDGVRNTAKMVLSGNQSQDLIDTGLVLVVQW